MIRLLLAIPLLCIALVTRPAGAQSDALRGRMDRFIAAVNETRADEVAGYFPRRAAWEVVRTPDHPAPGARTERRRIDPAALEAERGTWPTCSAFGLSGQMDARPGTLVGVQAEARPWRHVGGNRFVPPGRGAASPTFVEWQREGGTWVIARIGEVSEYRPRLLGRPAGLWITRDTTAGVGLPVERSYAPSADWYAGSAPLWYGRRFYVKHGAPVAIAQHELERFGSLGVIPVFAAAGTSDEPDVVYVPVAAGSYQPYSGESTSFC